MRDSLKHLFSNQITLEDKSQYYYTIRPYEFINALGVVTAHLQEYLFTKKEAADAPFSCTLYRTKDGNWYDIEEASGTSEKTIIRMLKSAVDFAENKFV